MSDAANEKEAAGRQEIRDMLDDRHHEEWEAVHGAHGVEELPSQLEARQERERATLEKRLDLLPPAPGRFATLDAFMRATDPLLQDEMAAGAAEVRSMLDAAELEDWTLWAGDWFDDAEVAEVKRQHADVRADVEYRLGEYQPLRGEFGSLDDFMSATEHLSLAREEAEITPEQRVRGFFSFAGSLENFGERVSRAFDIALGAVIGFFVDEPKLTASQVHDVLQAAGNLETLHARDYAAGVAVEAAAHEGRMLAMKGEQQTHDVRLAETLGVNATAEATIGLDEHEGARRMQKLSL